MIARRRCGAVAITLRSRRPSSAMPSVRGIGVAVSVSTSTSARSALIASLWRTPKRCSSSMTSRPRRLNLTSLRQQLVGADDDVDRAVGQAFERRLDLLGRAEARQLGHLHRPLAEAVDDVLVVLLGQQRGRRQQRHLLAAVRRRRRRRAARPRSCRSRRRRRPGGPSASGETMSWITAWIAARWSGVSSKPKLAAKAS